MIYFGFCVLVSLTLLFSEREKKVWGSKKTPFAFVAYPFLALLLVTVFIAPGMGFYSLHPETMLVIGLFFALFATASISLGRLGGARASAPSRLEAVGRTHPEAAQQHRVGNLEYIVLGGILFFFFSATIASRGAGDMVKGELGVGGIGGHLIEVGIAYLVIAASESRGQRLLRTVFVFLVLWLLGINQVKALLFLPLAGAVLYRWTSGQLATWKVGLIAIGAPLALGIAVYAYFGASAAVAGFLLTPALVAEIARHLMAYLVAGIIGLDQMLMQVNLVAFGGNGLEYDLDPLTYPTRCIL